VKTTLLIPVMNEIDGIRQIMPKIRPEWYDQLLILDGNSTDGTLEYFKEGGYDVYVQKRKGLRHGYTEIYDRIEGDVVITFSPDGNSIPELIPALVKKMEEGYDMVIVSRYKDEAKSYDDDAITRFGNWIFTGLINLLHGGRYTDAMVIFRAYRKELIDQLDLRRDKTYWPEMIFRTVLSWEPVMSVRSAKKKLRVAEIAGDEPSRIGGERKLQIVRWGSGYLAQILWETFFWR
jgi:glycosyltransferase involved in cell wall biosynthesis